MIESSCCTNRPSGGAGKAGRAVKVGKGAKEEKEEQNVDAKPKDV